MSVSLQNKLPLSLAIFFLWTKSKILIRQYTHMHNSDQLKFVVRLERTVYRWSNMSNATEPPPNYTARSRARLSARMSHKTWTIAVVVGAVDRWAQCGGTGTLN